MSNSFFTANSSRQRKAEVGGQRYEKGWNIEICGEWREGGFKVKQDGKFESRRKLSLANRKEKRLDSLSPSPWIHYVNSFSVELIIIFHEPLPITTTLFTGCTCDKPPLGTHTHEGVHSRVYSNGDALTYTEWWYTDTCLHMAHAMKTFRSCRTHKTKRKHAQKNTHAGARTCTHEQHNITHACIH